MPALADIHVDDLKQLHRLLLRNKRISGRASAQTLAAAIGESADPKLLAEALLDLGYEIGDVQAIVNAGLRDYPRPIVQPSMLPEGPNNWVWVAAKEYYLDEDGEEPVVLDPYTGGGYGGYWTCHKDTMRGDLILLYRKRPKMDFRYLIQADSDALLLTGELANSAWDYGCEYHVLHKFEPPLTLNDVREIPHIDEWAAFRGNFQRRAYNVPPDQWERLLDACAVRDADFARLRRGGEILLTKKRVLLEEELEQAIEDNPSRLKPFGYDLEVRGRQVTCTGYGGRLDLLCFDRREKCWVVIELKNVRAGRSTFGQVAAYLGWVEQNYKASNPPKGLVIARGSDAQFQMALATTDRISMVSIAELGFA
jgi:hypothetical protein